MNTLDGRARALAVALAALAGFIDAIGFIEFGGFFVSFMSGNTTRFGVGLAEGGAAAAIAGGLMAAFVVGVAMGVSIGRRSGQARASWVLVVTAAILAAAGVSDAAGFNLVAGLLLAAAMGAENAVFERDGRVRVGLTYMTGALVGLGQRLADVMAGRRPEGWSFLLRLWLGMATGATLGALTFPAFGLAALWIGAGSALALAVGARAWRVG